MGNIANFEFCGDEIIVRMGAGIGFTEVLGEIVGFVVLDGEILLEKLEFLPID
ncbi:MAG: hypothetical protein FWG64_12525 [Firmicutes bacterium]|nr:hypothetical protein [Bacillota bacterium]